jgi:predicted acetyltransferase
MFLNRVSMIECVRYPEIPLNIKEDLNSHIHNEFGHIPFVNNMKWSSPDWTLFIRENDEISTFLNIVLREVDFDNRKIHVAGINNVITPKKFRGNGYASKIMNEATNFIFNQLNLEHALLLCADSVIPFYKNLGWYQVDSKVYFDQPSGTKLYDSNTMLLTCKSSVSPREINLNGLPW